MFMIDAQSLPINFENDIETADFIDFDGGTATVLDNPDASGINTSNTVAQIVRDGGTIWSGSKIILAENLDFTSMNSISMKVYTSAPIGTTVKFKLEGTGSTERDVQTTVSNEWEELTWDFTGAPTDFNEVVFMFDFGNVGDGSINSTFYFDDIVRMSNGTQIDLPVDFEDMTVNYTMSDFGGNISSLTTDPEDINNHVIQVIKPLGAATWAGTTIGTPAGFATDVPLSLTDSKMTVRVWSPAAGTPIRLKLEDDKDPTHTVETETNTTVSNAWEIMEFDFVNQAPGTESLAIGLSMGWTYNMASIFFNFATDGDTAGETMYYFDDVSFGEFTSTNSNIDLSSIEVFPNPASDFLHVSSEKENILSVKIYDLGGQLLLKTLKDNNSYNIDVQSIPSGIYTLHILTNFGAKNMKLIKI